MKKILLALTAVAAFTGSAVAADMAVKAPPPVAPVYSWTGCYISGGGGYGMFKIDHNERANVNGGATLYSVTSNTTSGGDGWLVTGGGGCDYQFYSKWVVGGFADGTWSDFNGDHGTSLFVGDDLSVIGNRLKQDWSWAVGGRVGYLVNPTFLTYVNAGYTEAHLKAVNLNFLAFDTPAVGGPFTGVQLPGQTMQGYFIGSGFEYKMDWLPGLFVRSEGRANVYDRKNVLPQCVAAVGVCAAPNVPGLIGGFNNVDDRRLITYTGKVELVYRFNWTGAPLVAKY